MTWAREIDYESTYKTLLQELRKTDLKEGKHALIRRLYLIILLTQLRNGIRLKKAIEFVTHAVRTLNREAVIAVGGRKKRVILPEEISDADLLMVRGALEEKVKKGDVRFYTSVSTWALRKLGINTYSLSLALPWYLKEKYDVEIRRKRRKSLVKVFC